MHSPEDVPYFNHPQPENEVLPLGQRLNLYFQVNLIINNKALIIYLLSSTFMKQIQKNVIPFKNGINKVFHAQFKTYMMVNPFYVNMVAT